MFQDNELNNAFILKIQEFLKLEEVKAEFEKVLHQKEKGKGLFINTLTKIVTMAINFAFEMNVFKKNDTVINEDVILKSIIPQIWTQEFAEELGLGDFYKDSILDIPAILNSHSRKDSFTKKTKTKYYKSPKPKEKHKHNDFPSCIFFKMPRSDAQLIESMKSLTESEENKSGKRIKPIPTEILNLEI